MKTCNTCFVTSQLPGADIDETGQCHWCRESNSDKGQKKPSKINQDALQIAADRIKAQRVGAYDCVIGVSGGLDSTYVAYIAKKLMGLNPLLIHYDHGFFYDLPRENMVNMANDLGCDLRIIKSKKGGIKNIFVRSCLPLKSQKCTGEFAHSAITSCLQQSPKLQ